MRILSRLSRTLAAALAITLAAPAGAALANDEEGGDDANTLRIRTVAPKASPWGELLTSLASRIKKDTNDRLKIKIYWQSKSEPAAVRQCTQGKVGGIAVSMGALASAVPELNATEVPYLFESYAQADKAFRSAEGLIGDLMKAQGFILAVRGENGFRHFASKDKFLMKPADFKGLAMRSQPSQLHQDMYNALGATPNPIQVAEVPSSLQNGVVKGYDNTLLYGKLANWADGIKYVTLSSHIYQGAVIAWCKPWFDKLPADIKAALLRDDPKLEETGLKLVRAFNDNLMPAQYKKAGIELKPLAAGDKAALKGALASVEMKFRASASAQGKKLLDLLKASR
jgi:TRAP-type C4-dicarboxylate transport system substrate-binding protein